MQSIRLHLALPVTCIVLLLALKAMTVSMGLKTLLCRTVSFDRILDNMAVVQNALGSLTVRLLACIAVLCLIVLAMSLDVPVIV